jgi:hypothetical protein
MNQNDAGASPPALRTDQLGRRYGRVWGLRDCTLEVPAWWARTGRARPPCSR